MDSVQRTVSGLEAFTEACFKFSREMDEILPRLYRPSHFERMLWYVEWRFERIRWRWAS